MNAMRILHGNDIKLPSYKVLDIRKYQTIYRHREPETIIVI